MKRFAIAVVVALSLAACVNVPDEIRDAVTKHADALAKLNALTVPAGMSAADAAMVQSLKAAVAETAGRLKNLAGAK